MDWRGPIANTTALRGPDDRSGSAASDVTEKASSLREEASERARRLADEQTRAGADRMNSIARAVRSAADELEKQDMPRAAAFVQDAARRLEETSSDMRNSSFDNIAGQVGDLARRQPAAFFGGAVLAGFVLSRFLKSSGTDSAAERSATGAHQQH